MIEKIIKTFALVCIWMKIIVCSIKDKVYLLSDWLYICNFAEFAELSPGRGWWLTVTGLPPLRAPLCSNQRSLSPACCLTLGDKLWSDVSCLLQWRWVLLSQIVLESVFGKKLWRCPVATNITVMDRMWNSVVELMRTVSLTEPFFPVIIHSRLCT